MKVAIMPGDGIGREVTAQAIKVLRKVTPNIEMEEAAVGLAGVEAAGVPLPEESLKLARRADAILFGAAGGPGEEVLSREKRPGTALLQLRKGLGLFANFRPIKLYKELIEATTLKQEVVQGLDFVIIRELNSGIYFGEPREISTNSSGEKFGINTMYYSESEVEQVARVAFETARQRGRKVCSVDKANVLETMQLWREVVTRVSKDYPDIELTHLFVDAASMMLMRNPKAFDVIVTTNMFGDILSDAAAMLTGSIGMLPSASIGKDNKGLYEPIHGSAPDIAGKNLANPVASILSAAMMLRYSFNMHESATKIEESVGAVLAAGYRTADIHQPGTQHVTTEEMGDAIVERL